MMLKMHLEDFFLKQLIHLLYVISTYSSEIHLLHIF